MGTSNTSICERFANGGTDGKNAQGSIFIEGNTIYSYGYHFPMAHRFPLDVVLITTETYSSTTGKHVSKVHEALRESDKVHAIFQVPEVRAKGAAAHECNVQSYITRIEKAKKSSLRAKTKQKTSYYNNIVGSLYSEARLYIDNFDLKSNWGAAFFKLKATA